MESTKSRLVLAREHIDAVVKETIETVMTRCIFTKDDLMKLLDKYPMAGNFKGWGASLLYRRVRQVASNVELLKVRETTTRNVRVFTHSFWLIYRDEPQCREDVADILIRMLDPEVFNQEPHVAAFVIRKVLKDNGARGDVIRLVLEKLERERRKKKKKEKS